MGRHCTPDAGALRAAFDVLTDEREYLTELTERENGRAWSDAAAEASYATEFFGGSPKRPFVSLGTIGSHLRATSAS